jgi:hypothetical protein
MTRRLLFVGFVSLTLAGCVEIGNLAGTGGDLSLRGLVPSGGGGGGGGSVDDPDVPTGPEAPNEPTTDFDTLVREVNAGEVGRIPPIPRPVTGARTSSGLRLFEIIPGDGDPPVPRDLLRITYTGYRAEDGDLIMAGVNEQFTIIGGFFAIEGLAEGISTMREGEFRRIFIPPDLAFGEEGLAPNIPPGSILVYDIELLEIER